MTLTQREAEKGSVAAASLGGAAVGLTSHAAAGSQQDLVSLLAPARFMAPSAVREAAGLQFRLQVSHSPLVKLPRTVRSEGWVVLSTEPFQPVAAEQPPMPRRQRPATGQPI